jgi:hypothetical protein
MLKWRGSGIDDHGWMIRLPHRKNVSSGFEYRAGLRVVMAQISK